MAKILHLGNIANNAYNNAKHLNQTGPHDHYVLNFDNPHIMACPEWEEIDTFDQISEFNPKWPESEYTLPDWYQYVETATLGIDGTIASNSCYSRITLMKRKFAYWLKDQGLKKRGRKIELPADTSSKLLCILVLPCYAFLYLLNMALSRQIALYGGIKTDPTGYITISKKLESRLKQYDLIQAYGPDIIIPYLLGLPYIAYEHGTLRELPFDGSERAALLTKAYQQAEYTIITNPDVIKSSKRLGLKKITFIPHAVDCERFQPKSHSVLRKRQGLKDKLVLVAPARQNWDIKGNNKYISAFAKLVETFPTAVLFICDWGQHRDLTKQLVQELGLENRVRFYAPVPKLSSLHYYQMADIVLDQFEAGAFGGITPEAMACEKPTLVYYNKSVHAWCFESHPPLISVRTETEILEAITELAKSKEMRVEIGRQSRTWVENKYSIQPLVTRHNRVFEQVISQA